MIENVMINTNPRAKVKNRQNRAAATTLGAKSNGGYTAQKNKVLH